MIRHMACFRVEIRRLLCDRWVWLAAAVVVLSPLVGICLYHPMFSSSASTYATSQNSAYIRNPALAGALVGAMVFAILTAMEFSRAQRAETEVLIAVIASPFMVGCTRTIALCCVAGMAQLLTLMLWLPFVRHAIGAVFLSELYVAGYALLMFPPIVFAILFTAAAYQITYRLDLTLTLFVAFVLLSFIVWDQDWLLRWINPAESFLSDDFGNIRLLRSLAYSRLLWLLLLGGFWFLSLLGVRRYEKGLLGSCLCNIHKISYPILAGILLVGSFYIYTKQPFIDHSKLEIDFEAHDAIDYHENVAYSAILVDARPDLQSGCQWGTAVYKMHNTSGSAQTVSFKINPGYHVLSAKANDKAAPFRDLQDDDLNEKTIEVDLPADKELELVLEYGGFPQEWNILSLDQGEMEISAHSIYLTNQDFAPVPKNFFWNTEDLPPYTASIVLPKDMTPVIFGVGTVSPMGEVQNGAVKWEIQNKGGSIIFYAGDYITLNVEATGMDIQLYYSAKHQRILEECKIDEVLRQVFDYCTVKYGELSFYENQMLKLIEAGVGGGYAGRGSSTMGEDCFNEQGLRDTRKGAGGSEVMAHEIIHQWWGLGNMFESEPRHNEWSSEGLTVYTTYRLMKELYGDAYAKKNYVDKWQAQVDDYYQNFYARHPEYFEKLPEKFQLDITNSVAQVQQYCEMPLKILKAEQLVGGEQRMDQILRQLFNREITPDAQVLTYQQFLDACGLTEEDLSLV